MREHQKKIPLSLHNVGKQFKCFHHEVIPRRLWKATEVVFFCVFLISNRMRAARDWFLCERPYQFQISHRFGIQTKLAFDWRDCVSHEESIRWIVTYANGGGRREKFFFWRGRMDAQEIIEDIHHQKNISRGNISVALENYGLMLFIISFVGNF